MDDKIKEMRTDIGIAIHNAKQDYWYIEDDLPYWIAERLIEKGYRKESDTAREILTVIRRQYPPTKDDKHATLDDCYMINIIEDLACKYGVDLGE